MLDTTASHVLFWKKPARIEPGPTYLSNFAVYISISDPRFVATESFKLYYRSVTQSVFYGHTVTFIVMLLFPSRTRLLF